jgi:hypothetical protein
MKKEFLFSVLILTNLLVKHFSLGLPSFTQTSTTILEKENTITQIEHRKDHHGIFEILFGLLIILDDSRKNRRGHIWDTEYFSNGMREAKSSTTNVTTSSKVSGVNDFFQKFFEFFISSDENKHI